MDAFSLLSRSSAPRRKKAIPSTTAPVPSATNPKPQLFGRPINKIEEERQVIRKETSKKRKRGQDTAPGILPQELDFFSSAPQAAANGLKRETFQDDQHADGPVSDDAASPEEKFVADLPEEASRRILKDHKIKIARLDGAGTQSFKDGRAGMSDKIVATEDRKKMKRTLDVVPQPLMTFEHLRPRYGVNRQLAVNIRKQGYTTPTEVQLAALPLLLESKQNASSELKDGAGIDLLTVAPTGSGKTLAFLIPVIDSLARSKEASEPRAVILSPTKELAIQTVHEAEKLCTGTGLKVALARKSMRFNHDQDAGKADAVSDSSEEDNLTEKPNNQAASGSSPDIIVSTPLTLIKALHSNDDTLQPLENVRYLVLDEADVLLDVLFRKQTLSIWNTCINPNLRVSLWSATMGASVEELAQRTIVSRSRLLTPNTASRRPQFPTPLLRLVIGLKDSAIPHISHRLQYCGSESGKLLALRQLLRPGSNAIPETSINNSTPTPLRPPFLVFTQTIPRAQALHKELQYDIPPAAGGPSRIAVLHADLTSRARMEVMARMRRGAIWVLITTDLLSRGVDFKGINGVVNYDFPASSAGYVHRVGRTGRAGREGGVAVTLYDRDDMPYLKNVVNVIAAAQRVKGGNADGSAGGEGDVLKEAGLEKWLLESLPKTGKRERQKLKRRGVESRRPDKVEGKSKGRTRNKIDTRSGYEKRVEDRRKGAVEGSKRRKKTHATNSAGDVDDDGSFEGFG